MSKLIYSELTDKEKLKRTLFITPFSCASVAYIWYTSNFIWINAILSVIVLGVTIEELITTYRKSR